MRTDDLIWQHSVPEYPCGIVLDEVDESLIGIGSKKKKRTENSTYRQHF